MTPKYQWKWIMKAGVDETEKTLIVEDCFDADSAAKKLCEQLAYAITFNSKNYEYQFPCPHVGWDFECEIGIGGRAVYIRADYSYTYDLAFGARNYFRIHDEDWDMVKRLFLL